MVRWAEEFVVGELVGVAPVERPVALEPPSAEEISVPQPAQELHLALAGQPHFQLHYEREFPLYPLAGARGTIRTLDMSARHRRHHLLELLFLSLQGYLEISYGILYWRRTAL